MNPKTRRVSEMPGGETALILAAERLFAERGIEAVAMRHVNQAANQKNMSAAHYHFGSREGLVRAVVMHRWPELDERRKAYLERPDKSQGVRFYLEAFVMPLIDELAPREEGNHYIRFMQQYARNAGDFEFAKQMSPAGVAIYDNLERLIGYLPAEVRRLRIGFLINMIHSVLATTEERLENGEITHNEIGLIGANMIDMFANALTAPLSVDTLALLPATRSDAA